MPQGEGTYKNKVGRPPNKRTGPDYLDQKNNNKK